MKKTLAVPAHLIKDEHTEEELKELSKFGDKPLSVEETKQRELDEITHQESKKKKHNHKILERLNEIDLKSIRAIREGNPKRIDELEIQAVELRKQLI